MRFKKLERIFFMPNFALSTNGNGRRQAIFELLRQTTAGEGSARKNIERVINVSAHDAHVHIHLIIKNKQNL